MYWIRNSKHNFSISFKKLALIYWVAYSSNNVLFCNYEEGIKYGGMIKMDDKMADTHMIGDIQADAFEQGRKAQAKEIFDKFDEYACIKDDKWYKEFKKGFEL